MIQLKLKLNSKKPTTVYAVNGKTYLLNPGSNVLNLEYDDYLSLAKALGIKPVENKKAAPVAESKSEKKVENEPAAVKKADKKESEPEKAEEKVEAPAKDEPAPVEDTAKEEAPAKEEVPAEEPVKEEVKNEAPVEDAEPEAKAEAKAEAAEEVDYSTWTLKQLKAAYKELTGETCKLKKDEVIAFLQEHHA
jgi:outer membrane biosynthesis protein TonB